MYEFRVWEPRSGKERGIDAVYRYTRGWRCSAPFDGEEFRIDVYNPVSAIRCLVILGGPTVNEEGFLRFVKRWRLTGDGNGKEVEKEEEIQRVEKWHDVSVASVYHGEERMKSLDFDQKVWAIVFQARQKSSNCRPWPY